MANYIDTNILCETYVHIEAYELTPEVKTRIERFLAEQIRQKAGLFFEAEIEHRVDVVDGSLIIRATVLGSLAAVVLSTPSFRDSVSAAVEASRLFSDSLVVDGMVAARNKVRDVDHKEARLGVPGRIKRAITHVDRFGYAIETLSPEHAKERSLRLLREIETLVEDIPDLEDRRVVCDGLRRIVNENFPPRLRPQRSRREIRANAFRETDEFKALLEVMDRKQSADESSKIAWLTLAFTAIAAIGQSVQAYYARQQYRQTTEAPVSAPQPLTQNQTLQIARRVSKVFIQQFKERVAAKQQTLDSILADEAKTEAFKQAAVEQHRSWVCRELQRLLRGARNAETVKNLLAPVRQQFRCAD